MECKGCKKDFEGQLYSGYCRDCAKESSSDLNDGLCDHPGPECKYYEFYSRVSCLFVEGVEFMTRDAIYAAIKADWAGLGT